jgi:hypothetical protein
MRITIYKRVQVVDLKFELGISKFRSLLRRLSMKSIFVSMVELNLRMVVFIAGHNKSRYRPQVCPYRSETLRILIALECDYACTENMRISKLGVRLCL